MFFYYGQKSVLNEAKKKGDKEIFPKVDFLSALKHAFNTTLIYQYNPVNNNLNIFYTHYLESKQPEKNFFFVYNKKYKKKASTPPKTINLSMYLKAKKQKKSVNLLKA